MMLISILLIGLSFILDGFLSIYQFHIFSFSLLTLFTISSLVLIYPLLAHQPLRYFKIIIISGLIYDIVYTNTLFLNMLFFWLLAIIIKYSYTFVTYHLINSLFLNNIIIIFYQFLFFVSLVLLNYLPLTFKLWYFTLPSLIIVNNLYFIIIFLILRKACRKGSLKIIN